MKILFAIVFTVFAFTLSAQNSQTDSLKQVLNTRVTDSVRFDALYRLSFAYRLSKPDTALIFAKKGFELAKKNRNASDEAKSIRVMATIFYYLGNYSQSLEYWLQYLKINESINNQMGIASAYSNIANIYNIENNEKLAIDYVMKAKSIYEAQNQPARLVNPYTTLGISYFTLNMLDSALIYMNKAREIAITYNSINKGVISNNLGEIYAKMGLDDTAMNYYRESLQAGLSHNIVELVCQSYLGLAKLLKNEGQSDSAVYYSRLAMNAAKDGGFTNQILEASTLLSSYFKELNNPDSAYYYLEIKMAAKDSLFSQEKVRDLQNLSFNEKIRQQELEEARIIAEKKRKTNIQMLGVGTFISFFFILLFIVSKIKVKPWVTRFMGLISLLLLFEFISLLLSQFIGDVTHNNPILTLLILVLIAAILVPIHNKLQQWINTKLVRQN